MVIVITVVTTVKLGPCVLEDDVVPQRLDSGLVVEDSPVVCSARLVQLDVAVAEAQVLLVGNPPCTKSP